MTTEEFTDSEDVGEKPSYDARLEYYKVMKAYMMAIAKSTISEGQESTLKLLWGLFSMVQPFIKKEDAQKLKEKMLWTKMQLRGLYRTPANGRSLMTNKIDDELMTIQEDLFMASRYIMLPVDRDEATEFDGNSFNKESNL